MCNLLSNGFNIIVFILCCTREFTDPVEIAYIFLCQLTPACGYTLSFGVITRIVLLLRACERHSECLLLGTTRFTLLSVPGLHSVVSQISPFFLILHVPLSTTSPHIFFVILFSKPRTLLLSFIVTVRLSYPHSATGHRLCTFTLC